MRKPTKPRLFVYNCDLENTITGAKFNINIMAKSDKDLMDFIKNNYFHTELMKNKRIK